MNDDSDDTLPHSEGIAPPRRNPPVAIASGTRPWPRRYAITGVPGIVGYTSLEYALEWRQRAAGVVSVGPGYARVRDVFALYRQARDDRDLLRAYVQARDALRLQLEDGGTLPLAATVEWINEWDARRIIVHAAIGDERYWARRTRPHA